MTGQTGHSAPDRTITWVCGSCPISMSCITNRALACYGIAKLLGSGISGTIVTQRTVCYCAVTMDTIHDTIGDVMTACTRGIRTKVE